MSIKLVREFQQNQKLSITPQLKKSIDLLQLSRLEIINRINSEIDENPFLKKTQENFSNASFNNADIIENLSQATTLQSHLESQLHELKIRNHDKKIALALIQSIEDNGLLELEIEEIQDLLQNEFSQEQIKFVLFEVIQIMEPAGIGATNFKETIYLQLKRKSLSPTELSIAKEILFNPKYLNFDDAKNSLIEEHSEISIEQILSKIKKCNLSPGFEFQPTELIQPDLEVLPINDSRLDVQFREDDFPNITLDEDLAKLTKDKKNKANNTLKEKISDAKWLIRAINKRNETVHSVGSLICQIQADFLLNVSAELKPLTNIELAKNLKISASTVSRILRSKYIQTPKGAISMKSLLISSVSKTRKVTPAQLMEEIKGIVESESQTLSDQKISDMLNKRGFNLARRTISKYRMRVNIPSSRNR